MTDSLSDVLAAIRHVIRDRKEVFMRHQFGSRVLWCGEALPVKPHFYLRHGYWWVIAREKTPEVQAFLVKLNRRRFPDIVR